MFHTTFVQIALFNWLKGDIKGKFSKNVQKSSSQKPLGG